MREREEANRTREAGHLDEIQGVVANRLNAFRGVAVGFIVWLGGLELLAHYVTGPLMPKTRAMYCPSHA